MKILEPGDLPECKPTHTYIRTHMYAKKIPGLLLPLALAVSQASLANTHDDVYQFDNVIVTASRTAQTVDQTLAPVSVITRRDIERSQATSVTELLAKQPGIQIATNGGPGASASLQIRGTSSSQALVLVDEQRIGSATLGTASIQYFDPEQIERIEIVRGPRASLYGADAIGGVLNIITRKGAGAPKATLKTGYGSRNTRTASANIGGSTETTRYNVGISRFITDGYDRTTGKDGLSADDDSYYNTTASVKIDHEFNSQLSGGISFYNSEGTSEYDVGPAYAPRHSFNEQVFSGYAKYKFTESWQSKLTLSHTIDDDEVTRSSWLSTNKTTRNLVNWQNDLALNDQTLLTAGIDYYEDKYNGTSNLEKDSRDNKAAFIQTQTNFDNSDLQVALRRDNNEEYGNNTTGNIAWGYNLPADIRLIASYGTAFRAPTFNDLYSPSGGNPNLKPEEAKNKELELRGKFSFGHWSVAAYQNDIDHMIDWKPTSTAPRAPWAPYQVDSARIRGLDTQLTLKLADWEITGALSLLDAKDKNTDQYLTYRAKQTASLDIYRNIGQFGFGGTVRAQSDTYTNEANTDTLSGFATIDLRGEWQATKELKAGLRVVNLLDKEYSTRSSYIDEPRGVFATLTWTPAL